MKDSNDRFRASLAKRNLTKAPIPGVCTNLVQVTIIVFEGGKTYHYTYNYRITIIKL